MFLTLTKNKAVIWVDSRVTSRPTLPETYGGDEGFPTLKITVSGKPGHPAIVLLGG